MTQKTRTSLVVIQTLIAILSLVMLAAGLFGSGATKIIDGQQKKSSELNFDEKLRPSIGKPYTEERHYQLLELMRTHDEANASTNKSLAAACIIMRNVGGLLALSSMASIFLLLRKLNIPEQAAPNSGP